MCSSIPIFVYPATPQDRQQEPGRNHPETPSLTPIDSLDSLALDHCLEPVQVQVIATDETSPDEVTRQKQAWEENQLLIELQCEV